ncbi:hypothetical protein [Chroococcus sp. FPU101]|uniref:hypothetical protein n=1 Tax=Chroococcus sp. FPU101 TaxID=1974212 RepID=UPI001A8FEE0E|nr:hypothetical protein [Chroococcus sp. FPU101]GFE69850.1 hypothetical protein CFPU101_24600 [Chroococcus sp. FPU101]
MRINTQDLVILLEQLELLHEQNVFLQDLVDSQNIILQKTQQELDETKQELQQSNFELSNAFAEVSLKMIELEKFLVEFTEQYLTKEFPTTHDSTITSKNLKLFLSLVFQTKDLTKIDKADIILKLTELRKPTQNFRTESKNLRDQFQKFKSQFFKFKVQYQEAEKQLNELMINLKIDH